MPGRAIPCRRWRDARWRLPVRLLVGGAFSLGAGQNVRDVGPQLLPLLALCLGHSGQGLGGAHAGKVLVLLPVPHLLLHDGAGLGGLFLQHPAPGGQVFPQPAEGLPAQAGMFVFAETAGVLALAAAGQRGGAGGVVAVAALQFGGYPGVRREGLGVPARGGGVELFVHLAEEGQRQALGGIGRLRLPLQELGQAVVQVGQPLGLTEPLGGGVGPGGVARAQLVTQTEFSHGLPEAPLLQQGAAEIAVGLGVVHVVPESLPVFSNGVVQPAFVPQQIT